MVADSVLERGRENATGIASTVVTAVWLAGLVTGQDWWLAALLVGYIAVVPLVAVLFGDEEDREEWWEETPTANSSPDDRRTRTAKRRWSGSWRPRRWRISRTDSAPVSANARNTCSLAASGTRRPVTSDVRWSHGSLGDKA